MISAYVLIIAKSGAEKDVVEQLKKHREIKSVEILYGEYDVLTHIQVDEISKLNDFLLAVVRKIDGVEKTSTLISAN